ncbi:alpha/beta hydrolase [Haloarchaeobius sp. HME9146]|uniref:alpha/beta fold hydrolase n=1 Tax=Haloarchaeobius sp. HME9146 TaxID=2978732 RepID=UPI0021C21C97|nr:alpha/beta hydrolase [Haloarchaeobius sp. HME9146]
MIPAVETGRVADHPYVSTGDGPRTLLVIPGLNDPLHTVGDSWWFPRLMAMYLQRYADTHTVYMVSRPHGIPADATVASMARGYEAVLDELDAESTPLDVFGLSMGGFLVQALAARDDRVDRAVLGLSATTLSEHGRDIVERWRDWGERGTWGPIYREAYAIVADGLLARCLQAGSVGYDLLFDPENPADFLVSADACLDFDGTAYLAQMDCPTLVVGGDEDVFFTAADYRETAAALPDGTLAMLRGAGHESVIEHPDEFDGSIRRFLSA